jgi:hypothetical protein
LEIKGLAASPKRKQLTKVTNEASTVKAKEAKTRI